MSEFFGSGEVQTTSVSFTVDSVTVNTLNTAPKYVTATSAPKYLPKPKKLSFAGSSKVTLSLTAGSSTKYTAKSSKIEVVTYLDEYSDSGATELKSTKRLDKVELDGLGTLTYDFATLPETYISGGAYYVVRVECALAPTILPIGATDNSTTPDITVTASIKQTSGSNITVNIKANDTGYVSRHFANGLCLASATDNYTLIKYDSTDGTMSFETRAGAYGLQVTSDGIKKYDGTTWIDADI
jgi:hypothetical protein